ncbi:MAG: transcription termination/antitermination protein NusA [Proteobacteria bacterium]|nr:transcription termination/antitermination protein NusA [Pseudomonadota bacterium]
MDTTALSRTELLQVADAVAREKSIEREEVLDAMEQAISKAGRAKYGHEHDIRAEIDRKTGEVRLRRFREVTDEVENEVTQMTVSEGQARQPGIEAGEFVIEDLPPIDLGRIAAQTAKQVIVQKVREAERQRQYREYKDRAGEVVNGIVKRNEFGNVTIDLSRAEAMMRRDESLPRESFRTGDRVRGYIYDVREEPRGPQIFVSRSHPQFMAKLFAQEVPEIYDSIIEIKSVARDPGSRAKIAVISHDSSIDPVGACVGMRGSRVQAVVSELQGEKIDIIPWSPDTATFVVNALAPAEVTKVVLDEEQNRIEVVVPDEQLSLAIGRRGQNVRLASMLTGWDIDILTEEEESRRRQEETRTRSQLFIEALDVDDVIAHLLVAEGFTSLEQVAFVPVEEVTQIEGFDEDVAEELRARARSYLEELDRQNDERRRELGVSDELTGIAGLTPTILVALGENQIKTLDDLGDLASDELIELLGELAPGHEEVDAIIMAARAHWFDDEESPTRRPRRPRARGRQRDRSPKAPSKRTRPPSKRTRPRRLNRAPWRFQRSRCPVPRRAPTRARRAPCGAASRAARCARRRS